MDGLKQTYKQSQSFGMSDTFMGYDLANRNKFPNHNKTENFPIRSALKFNTGNEFSETITTLSNPPSTSIGAVVINSNGNIVCIPKDGTIVTGINYETDFVGSSNYTAVAGSDKYYGGVLFRNTLVAIPTVATSILKIDLTVGVENSKVSYYGSLGAGTKWIGGVIANGYVWGVPFDSNFILKTDPVKETVELIPVTSGTAKYFGCVLAPNGFIYCIPYNATSILKINPYDNSFTYFGNLTGSAKWSCGVLSGDGNIYCIPNTSASVLKINTNDDSVSLFGSLGATANKWIGGALGPNGIIYGMAFASTAFLRINPFDDSVSTFGSLGANPGLFGAILAPNGCIYCISGNTVRPMRKIGISNPIDPDFAMNRYFNKF